MKKLFLTLLFLFAVCATAKATPPHDMQLKYDPATQSLSVTMKHPTIERREHYIRTITVVINGGEPQVFRYNFQNSASQFDTTIPLALKAGDSVHVTAACRLGGSAEAEFSLPAQAPSEQSPQEK